MNPESFVAANTIALITHTVVSISLFYNSVPTMTLTIEDFTILARNLLLIYSYNLLIWSESDLRCFKKARPSPASECREVGTHSRFWKRFIKLAAASENTSLRK
jgi:hypothetical protein